MNKQGSGVLGFIVGFLIGTFFGYVIIDMIRGWLHI